MVEAPTQFPSYNKEEQTRAHRQLFKSFRYYVRRLWPIYSFMPLLHFILLKL